MRKAVFIISCFLLLVSVLPSPGRAGKRFTVRRVEFKGNIHYSAGQLYRQMICRPSRLFRPSVYLPELFRDDLTSIEKFYHNNGFLGARIIDYRVFTDSLKGQVDIAITVEEGARTFVEDIGFFGNERFPDERLARNFSLKPGEPLSRQKVESGVLSILTLYANNGFLDAVVTPEVRLNEETHRALIDITIEEGKQYRVGEIHISGLEKTREYVVHRELLFRSGEIINHSTLLKSQRKLYLTGLFQSVFVHTLSPETGDTLQKDVLIEVQETLSSEFNVSVGYGSVEKLRGRMEFFNQNLQGTARKIAVGARVSWIQRGLDISFTEPWTFGVPIKTDGTLFNDFREEPGFRLTRWGGRLTAGYDIRNGMKTTLTYRHSNNRLSDVRVRSIPPDVRNNVRSLTWSFIYDSRDNLFNPSRGGYLELSKELGGAYWSGLKKFIRVNLQWKLFRSLSPALILAHAAQFGWMDSQGGLKAISVEERFYAGGPNSLRAFDYQKVGPLDENGRPMGGRFKIVFHLAELRASLYKSLGGVLFAEAGNVWSIPEQFNLRDLRPVLGLGVRMNSPVGLARLDFGWNAKPQPGEAGVRVYFSMGQAF